MRGDVLAAAVALLLCVCGTKAQLGATWIPTDLNYALISSLRGNALQAPGDQLAGYATLGIIPVDVVAAWLNELVSNPSFQAGVVRWTPTVASKCSNNVLGCTKSISITVLEYTYVDINATDCKAHALVAATASLPQQTVLTDGVNAFEPVGTVNYEITAAPNSTAEDCTYVVQYPKTTQTLANQLCDAGCFNSTCQPCNANQTLTGGGDTNNCTPNSGISPSLVAAIQGAAQCLGYGTLGRFQCQVAFSANNSACSQMSCFPGDASVVVEGRGRSPMKDVRIGDRVQVALADGSLAYDHVYMFGHRARHAMGSFVKLTLQSRSGKHQQRAIELSAKHFIPASSGGDSWAGASQRRAQDVLHGDTVWAQAGSSDLAAFRVTAKELVTKEGLWAPYTAAGTIIVDGVAASVHSDWILDGIFDAIGRPDLLPAVYQALFTPVRALYRLMGSGWMQDMDARYDFGGIATAPLSTGESRLPAWALATAVAAAVPLGLRLRAQSRKL